MAFVETRDGTRLFAKSWGEGRPIVLIHGWPLSSDSWDPQAMHLANAGFRVIAYDRRGFGRSDQPWTGYDYDTFTDDLADMMKATGATSDVALVGFSMGGGEVARYMSRYNGEGVARVALVSSVVPYMAKDDHNPDGVDQDTFDQMTQGMKDDYRAFFSGFFKDFFGIGGKHPPVSEETLHWAWAQAMMAGQHPTLASAKAFATTDFRPDLAHFNVPTLVVHGTGDKTVPIDATSRVVADKVKGATLMEYEGAPHGLFASHQDKLAQDLLEFIQR